VLLMILVYVRVNVAVSELFVLCLLPALSENCYIVQVLILMGD
jgi:hypothetical protein